MERIAMSHGVKLRQPITTERHRDRGAVRTWWPSVLGGRQDLVMEKTCSAGLFGSVMETRLLPGVIATGAYDTT